MTGETCRLVGVRGEEIVAVSAEPDGLDDLAGLDLAQILHALTAGRNQRAFMPLCRGRPPFATSGETRCDDVLGPPVSRTPAPESLPRSPLGVNMQSGQ